MELLKSRILFRFQTIHPKKMTSLRNLSVSFLSPISVIKALILNVSGRYQGQMLRSLKEVGSGDSVIGFYQATRLGAFLKQPLVEAQAVHQEKLRHGGIVIIHGKSLLYNMLDIS
jgi:hypothetical protein